MKRSIAALTSAVMLTLIAAAPTAAVGPTAPGGSGSMTASACVDGSSILHVTVNWNNETVNSNKDLTIMTRFSGGVGMPFTAKNSVSKPVLSTGSDSFGFVLSQGSSWSDWPNIDNKANGAFKDTAPTLSQSATGWPLC